MKEWHGPLKLKVHFLCPVLSSSPRLEKLLKFLVVQDQVLRLQLHQQAKPKLMNLSTIN